ncbi:MAG: hypothetical protein RL568_489, partial [Actinomycetota bacterium]
PENMDDAQTALASFGQFDVRVTPLQMALITAAIANGGKEMNPQLIENVQSSNLALLSQTQPSEFASPISKATADGLKQMMIAAVKNGVSTNGQVPGTVVAGKTGTAQNGGNSPYTLWFAGFAPADNPQVAVAVVIAASVLPQLVTSVKRIRLAQRLRGQNTRGLTSWKRVAIPLLEESLARSLDLAAAMDSRGYGVSKKRSRYRPISWRLKDSLVVISALGLVVIS